MATLRKDTGNAANNIVSAADVYSDRWVYVGSAVGADSEVLWVDRTLPNAPMFWLVTTKNGARKVYRLTAKDLFGQTINLGKSATTPLTPIYRTFTSDSGKIVTFNEAQQWRMALGDGTADILELVVGVPYANTASQSPYQTAIALTPASIVNKSDLGVPILSAVSQDASGSKTILLADLVKTVPPTSLVAS